MEKQSHILQTNQSLTEPVKVQSHTRYKVKNHYDKQKLYEVFQSYATTGRYSVTEAVSLTARACKVSVRTVNYARNFFDKGKDKLEQLEIAINLLRKEIGEIKAQLLNNQNE